MRLPSKVTPYKRSILSKFPPILSELQKKDMRVVDLYEKMKKKNVAIDDFIEALDCLFVLGKVEFMPDKEVLRYVERDSV